MVGRAVKTVIFLYIYEASSRVVGFIVAILKFKMDVILVSVGTWDKYEAWEKLIINRLASTGHSRLSW